MLSAFVLAAGLGTRLRPLSDERAKPTVPVGDRPLLAHVVAAVRAVGAERVVANAHFRADDVRALAAELGVSVADEPELLGTAGGLANAGALLGDGPVLLYNGDIYAPELDLGGLVGALLGAQDAFAAMAVRPRPRGEGNVGIGEGNRIVRLRTTSFGEEQEGGEFLGIHAVSAAFRALTPKAGGLIEDVYLPAMGRGALVTAFRVGVAFHDVGTLAGYAAANAAWLAVQGLRAWADPTATVDPRVTLDGSLVGAGARVTGSGTLARCVVWPGARAEAPLADTAVTPTQRVVLAPGSG